MCRQVVEYSIIIIGCLVDSHPRDDDDDGDSDFGRKYSDELGTELMATEERP